MDTKKLRQKILDLAIRGKLVPQDPNDEPASVLLERIKAEKERLIQEGKIKRPKKSTADTSHYQNFPFDIPESWKWVTIGNISDSSLGKMLDKKKVKGTPLHYLRNVNVRWESFDLSDLLEMPFKAEEIDRYSIKKGDLVICEGGEPGRCAIWNDDKDIMYQKALHRLRPFHGVLNKYLLFVLMQYSNSGHLENYYTGSTIKHLTGESLSSLFVPIPPYNEQQKIICEIEKCLGFVGTIEKNNADLQSTVNQAKAKVLDLAIHGQLVSQKPEEEPAIELLKRINPNIKIPCDNPHYPYKIPNSWCWAKGNMLFAPMQSCSPKGNVFKYIDIDTIDNKNNSIKSVKVVPTKEAPSRASRFTKRDDTLFSMVRPYLRNIAIVNEDDCIASTGFYVCRTNGCLDDKYCFYMMLSSYVVDGLNAFMKGDNSPSINKGHVESFVYPLPPMNEQKRIVIEVEKYFRVLDKIKESLTA
jgi:type I restriction enzyme S subunit